MLGSVQCTLTSKPALMMLWMREFAWPWSQPLMLLSVDRAPIITLEGAALIWPTVRPTLWLPSIWIVVADKVGNFATSVAVIWVKRRMGYRMIRHANSNGQCYYRDWYSKWMNYLWTGFSAEFVDAWQNGLTVCFCKGSKCRARNFTDKSTWYTKQKDTHIIKMKDLHLINPVKWETGCTLFFKAMYRAGIS